TGRCQVGPDPNLTKRSRYHAPRSDALGGRRASAGWRADPRRYGALATGAGPIPRLWLPVLRPMVLRVTRARANARPTLAAPGTAPHAPPPQKSEIKPANTGIVVGDAYALEQAYAESTRIGVVSKVRSSAGLIDQCKDEFGKWLEQSLANEQPAFIAVRVGMNDRR